MAESAYQTKQSLWQKTKNAGKEAIRKGKPKIKAAAKVAGHKAVEGGRWAAREAFKAYKEGSKAPRKKSKGKKGKSRRSSSSRSKRRIIIEDY